MLGRLTDAADLAPGDRVVELGAGAGQLTRHLADRVGPSGRVLAIELDPVVLVGLRVLASEQTAIVPYAGDVLEVDFPALLREHSLVAPVKVAGNLPYYITTPILERLIQARDVWESATLTIQDEVAQRITAAPGTKACGSISVYLSYYCELTYVFQISPGSFSPPPSVHSAVVRLIRREHPAVSVTDESAFFAIVRAAFGQRRKTLRNALQSLPWRPSGEGIEAALASVDVDARRRGETLSMDEFGAIANALVSARSADPPA